MQPPEEPPTSPDGFAPIQPGKHHHWYRPRNISLGTLALIIGIGVAAYASGGGGNTASTSPRSSAAPTVLASPSLSPDFNGVTCDPSTMTDGYCPGDAPSPPPSTSYVGEVGQTATIGDAETGAAEGMVTVRMVGVTTQPADPSYGSQPANGYYVIIKVKAVADPAYTGGFSISDADFYTLVGDRHYDNGNGNAYEALKDYQSAQSLNYTTLGAGETTAGYLSFDVPSRHGKIVYSPNLDGQPVAEWQY